MTIWKIPEIREIKFGYGGLVLIPEDELEEAQLGYSRHPDGSDLSGASLGTWKREWIVIGRDLLTGDPIFVNTSEPELPVFTAVHGTGSWEPKLISSSYWGFLEILIRFESIAEGRDHPAALEAKPMTQEEYDSFLAFVELVGEIKDTLFWALMIADQEA